MRGKRRTKEEQHELFSVLEGYLEMGFSLKKACSLADVPYSTMRDITSLYEPLRAYTTALQNKVNVTARAIIIASIEKGNVNDAKWWVERFDHPEPQISPVYGGENEMVLTYMEAKQDYLNGFNLDEMPK
jgi:hypothetical protein